VTAKLECERTAGARFEQGVLPYGDHPNRLGLAEILFWCAIGATVFFLSHSRANGPRFLEDSYQYISVASNLAHGHGLRTSIIHYDTERAHGTIPAVMTTFPPGYPALIAAVASFGLTLEMAAVFLVAVSFLLLLPLIAMVAAWMGISTWATRMTLALVACNAQASFYSTAILTESVFAALSCGALFLYIRHEQLWSAQHGIGAVPGNFRYAAAASTLVAAGSLVRYAGLFLFLTVAVYYGVQLFRRRDRTSLAVFTIASAGGIPIGALFVRNMLLTGSWQGGNTKIVNNPIMPVLKQFGRAMFHIFCGEDLEFHLTLTTLALAVSTFTLFSLAVIGIIRSNSLRHRVRLPAGLQIILLYLVVYTGALIYLGAHSDITFNSRYFYPLMPLLYLLLALCADRIQAPTGYQVLRAGFACSWVVVAVSLAIINVQNARAQEPVGLHRDIALRFARVSDSGVPLRQWFGSNVPKDAVLVAAAGQPTAYALNRETVSLIKPSLSDMEWGESALHEVMRKYRARFLLLYPLAGRDVADEQASPFLKALLTGPPPTWLHLAAENLDVRVFQLASEPGDQPSTRSEVK
jgi:hypothetical protein